MQLPVPLQHAPLLPSPGGAAWGRYHHLTTRCTHAEIPAAVVEALEGLAPLPELSEPAVQPLLTEDCGEELVALIGIERLVTEPAYVQTGWDGPVVLQARSGVAARLARAASALPAGFGLVVLDAHRSGALQQALYEDAYRNPNLPAGFVTPPSTDSQTPPPHLTGGAVNVTLSWRGISLGIGTPFDEFTDEAYTSAFEDQPGVVRGLRRLLYQTMAREGFVVHLQEWWHFEYGTRRWAALRGVQPRYGAV